jgi:hypothetical protein
LATERAGQAPEEEEDPMTGSEDQQDSVKPSEQRGGTTPGERESREKGEWAARAAEGVVPPELGGSDAPREALGEDPELGSSVLGKTSGSEEPATEEGIDAAGGQNADATSDGGPERPEGAEPDLRDAASGPRQSDVESGE